MTASSTFSYLRFKNLMLYTRNSFITPPKAMAVTVCQKSRSNIVISSLRVKIKTCPVVRQGKLRVTAYLEGTSSNAPNAHSIRKLMIKVPAMMAHPNQTRFQSLGCSGSFMENLLQFIHLLTAKVFTVTLAGDSTSSGIPLTAS